MCAKKKTESKQQEKRTNREKLFKHGETGPTRTAVATRIIARWKREPGKPQKLSGSTRAFFFGPSSPHAAFGLARFDAFLRVITEAMRLWEELVQFFFAFFSPADDDAH